MSLLLFSVLWLVPVASIAALRPLVRFCLSLVRRRQSSSSSIASIAPSISRKTEMGNHTAFFYGTLMAPPVLYRVCHGSPNPQTWQKESLNIRSAVLHGYSRHCVRGCDYPGIVPRTSAATANNATTATIAPGAVSSNAPLPSLKDGPSVHGTVVTGLTDGDMFRLDVFEGDQYDRKEVIVYPIRRVSGDEDPHSGEQSAEVIDEPIRAMTYVWRDSRDELEEREWSLNEFLRDKLRDWVGVERPDYLAADEAARKLEERTAQDAAKHGDISVAKE